METQKYYKAKQAGTNTRVRQDLEVKCNDNSADFIIPNLATGCEAACAYCYVARHNTFGNPLTKYTNVDKILQVVLQHHSDLPAKYPKKSNQQDKWQWVYDVGEATDMLSPAMIDTTNYVINQLLCLSNIKPSFATKLSTPYSSVKLKDINQLKARRARVRVSVMPPRIADVLEAGTAKMNLRLASIRTLYELGYEVHLNFSPVIVCPGWEEDYIQLMNDIDEAIGTDTLGKMIKQQLAAEVIMLTHHPKLHKSNLEWNTEAEDILWRPSLQEPKTNRRGGEVLRYQIDYKKKLTQFFAGMIKTFLPYCRIRYIF